MNSKNKSIWKFSSIKKQSFIRLSPDDQDKNDIEMLNLFTPSPEWQRKNKPSIDEPSPVKMFEQIKQFESGTAKRYIGCECKDVPKVDLLRCTEPRFKEERRIERSKSYNKQILNNMTNPSFNENNKIVSNENIEMYKTQRNSEQTLNDLKQTAASNSAVGTKKEFSDTNRLSTEFWETYDTNNKLKQSNSNRTPSKVLINVSFNIIWFLSHCSNIWKYLVIVSKIA